MRVKHEVRATPDSPTNSLGITPSFVTDCDTKLESVSFENVPFRTGRINRFFGRIKLDLVLKSGDRSVSINHECCNPKCVIDEALGSENNRQLRFRGSRRDVGPSAFEECRVRWWNSFTHPSITGNKAFRKADHTGVVA